MTILLDECCPKPLAKALSEFTITTTDQAGLKGFKNGDLIDAAEGSFDVVITADKNLRYQQNLKNRKIAILELPFNSWPRLRNLLPEIRRSLLDLKPGDYLEMEAEQDP